MTSSTFPDLLFIVWFEQLLDRSGVMKDRSVNYATFVACL